MLDLEKKDTGNTWKKCEHKSGCFSTASHNCPDTLCNGHCDNEHGEEAHTN